MAGFAIVRPDTAFANAAPKGKKRPRDHDRDHLAMIRQLPCCVCGEIKVEAHHADYSKPLEVIWFCRKHHIQYHKDKDIVNPEFILIDGEPVRIAKENKQKDKPA